MDWENERWIKVYTRDTVTWKLLSWEAQGLFLCLLRRVDRAGVLDLSGRDAPKALAALLDWPVEVVDRALPELADSGTIEYINQGQLVVPNFIEAQEAKPTDAQRKRESRARRRDRARLAESVPMRDGVSQIVTVGHRNDHHRHTQSHAVTPRQEESNSPQPPKGEAARVSLSSGESAKASQPCAEDTKPAPLRLIAPDASSAGDAQRKRKQRAREILARYEQRRVDMLHSRGVQRKLTDSDYRAMVRLMRHIREEYGCDETEAWTRLEKYGQIALDEAAAALKRGDDNADKLVGWRRGPTAWRRGRYDAVMAKAQAEKRVNGKSHRKVKKDEVTGEFFFFDKWHRKFICDENGRLPVEEGYIKRG